MAYTELKQMGDSRSRDRLTGEKMITNDRLGPATSEEQKLKWRITELEKTDETLTGEWMLRQHYIGTLKGIVASFSVPYDVVIAQSRFSTCVLGGHG